MMMIGDRAAAPVGFDYGNEHQTECVSVPPNWRNMTEFDETDRYDGRISCAAPVNHFVGTTRSNVLQRTQSRALIYEFVRSATACAISIRVSTAAGVGVLGADGLSGWDWVRRMIPSAIIASFHSPKLCQ